MAGVEKVADFLNKLFGPTLKKLRDAGKKLLSGDVAGFVKDLGSAVAGAFTTTKYRNHKKTVLLPHGDVCRSVAGYDVPACQPDEYNCPHIYETWDEQTCGSIFAWSCGPWRAKSRFIQDLKCLEQRARDIVKAEEIAEDTAELEEDLAKSEENNPGYAAVLNGEEIPAPRINDVGGNFTTSGGSLATTRVETTFAGGVRALAGKGGSGVEATETSFSADAGLDYGSPEAFESSLLSAKDSISKQAGDKALKNQAGVDPALEQKLGQLDAQRKAAVRHSGAALDVSEFAAPVLGSARPLTEVCVDTSFSGSFADAAPPLEYTDPLCTGIGAIDRRRRDGRASSGNGGKLRVRLDVCHVSLAGKVRC
ncbi:hypothetical protein DIPPA_32155 [Diplonema papillatum]|nr:hypothetical protein DIPPA_32155 [Diplonema papillatum]